MINLGTFWHNDFYRYRNGAHPLVRSFIKDAERFNTVKIDAVVPGRVKRLIRKRMEPLTELGRQKKRLHSHLEQYGLASYYGQFSYYFGECLADFDDFPAVVTFDHTSPPVLRSRPYVFHFESFPTLFTPIRPTGTRSIPIELQHKVISMLADSFRQETCILIFSHLKSSVDIFHRVFHGYPDICRKCIYIPLGIEAPSMTQDELDQKFSSDQKTRILFTNSLHNQPASFFKRGGHLLLSALENLGNWQDRFELTIVSSIDEEIRDRFSPELLRQITWYDTFVPFEKMKALKDQAHIFAMPAIGLHSYSLLEAIRSYSIPIISDALGYEEFFREDDANLWLYQMTGVRDRHYFEEETGWVSEDYTSYDLPNDDYIEQVSSFLESLSGVESLRSHAEANAESIHRNHDLKSSQSTFARALEEALN